jgi:hypothetical protein
MIAMLRVASSWTYLLMLGCGRFGFPALGLQDDAAPAVLDARPAGDARPFAIDASMLDGGSTPAGLAGSLQNTSTGPLFRLYLGVSSVGTAPSYLKEFSFDRGTSQLVDVGYLQFSTPRVKAVDVDASGYLTVAHAEAAPVPPEVAARDPQLTAAGQLALSHDTDPAREIAEPSALCFLPGGTFIAASGLNAPGNKVNEYDSGGRMIRAVFTATIYTGVGRAFSMCVSRSDLEFFAVDVAVDATSGRFLRFARPDTSSEWSIADEVWMSDLDDKFGTSGTRLFGFAIDRENERAFLLPFDHSDPGITRLVQCPTAGFSAANCILTGDPVPGGAVYSAIHIPGTEDLLVPTGGWYQAPSASAHRLYRFRGTTGTWTELFDLSTMNLGGAPYSEGGTHKQVWGYPVFR